MNILTTTASFSAEIPNVLNVIHNPYGRKLTEEEIMDMVIQYKPVGIIAGVEPLTGRVLEKASGLRIISRCGIGVDSVDLEAARKLGIKVAITPEAPVVSVAELTLGLILGSLRRINTLDSTIRKGGWKGPQGSLLSGKTVGIIGCGRIGTKVARLVSAFDCKVIGCDPFITKHDICCMTDFRNLLEESDIVTLHIPYTKDNRHMIGKIELSAMKKSAVLINAARGGLIDETALYDALKAGGIASAALDCFETEPYAGPLIELDNIILSPHAGSSALEARTAMEKQAVENLLGELKELSLL